MATIYHNITELIGNTPLIALTNTIKSKKLKANLLIKVESFNPAGSVKDRAALYMIQDAEERGILHKGDVLVEPTSGNTGIGLASIAASKGYKTVFTMPETMSVERRALLKSYGAEIVLTEGKLGMKGAIAKAQELVETKGMIQLGQFTNPANVKAHFETTGPEIWKDTDGQVHIFVAGVGTGGTITGTGTYLKKQNPSIKVVAVEPQTSAVLSGENPGPHGIMGIGAGFIPEILDTTVYDDIIRVTNDEAYEAARKLAFEEGILVGISSGAALHAGFIEAEKEENANKTIVVLLPDTGERYLSTPLFI